METSHFQSLVRRDDWQSEAKKLVPFGLGNRKPRHFLDMFKVLWDNKDNLGYAYKTIMRGVCDGCALGVAGLHDWTIEGPHLCMTRLNLLRLNTMPALDHDQLSNISKLKSLSNQELRKLGRLAYPMWRPSGAPGFQRISWEEAYSKIAARIRKSNPDRLAFFVTSRGVTNEIYYVAQKVSRFLGVSSIDNAARLCHSPSTGAMKRSIGVAATTCSYKDWYGTDLIVFFGANPANDQPVTTKYLHEAKELGAKIAFVNPYKEPGMDRYWVPSTPSSALLGTDIMDYWFPVTQGGDIGFLYGTLKILIENGWVDESFIKNHTVEFDQLTDKVSSLDWETLERQSGLSKSMMQEFAELIHSAKNAVLVWSMGITQHVFGADAVSMILNLGLSQGYVGRDKCGLMPIRGHSSVQGGAEMGAYTTALPGGLPLTDENCKNLEEQYGFPIPRSYGLTTTEMVEACSRGELDLLYCLGGNFLRTLPDPDAVVAAMEKTPMRVHQDIILTDQMWIDSAEETLLLPAKTRYEQEGGGFETTTERRVIFSPEIPRQVGEAETEWKILLNIAKAVDPKRAHLLGCETGQAIREEVARVVPFYDGVQHLKKTGDAFQYGGPHLCANGVFPMPNEKAVFWPVELPKERSKDPNQFLMSTRRGKQFNTLIYAEIDPLNGAARDSVLMSEVDASRLQLKHGDKVVLESLHGKMQATVFVAPIAPGNLQTHWPESNHLIPTGVVDPSGKVPDYNAFVSVTKAP